MPNILITGGAGRLANELKKYLEGDYLDKNQFDFTGPVPEKKYDLILHIGAYTDVKRAETNYRECFMVNTYGTLNLVQNYKDTPFIFISTEYDCLHKV